MAPETRSGDNQRLVTSSRLFKYASRKQIYEGCTKVMASNVSHAITSRNSLLLCELEALAARSELCNVVTVVIT